MRDDDGVLLGAARVKAHADSVLGQGNTVTRCFHDLRPPAEWESASGTAVADWLADRDSWTGRPIRSLGQASASHKVWCATGNVVPELASTGTDGQLHYQRRGPKIGMQCHDDQQPESAAAWMDLPGMYSWGVPRKFPVPQLVPSWQSTRPGPTRRAQPAQPVLWRMVL